MLPHAAPQWLNACSYSSSSSSSPQVSTRICILLLCSGMSLLLFLFLEMMCVCFLFIYFVHSKWDSLPKSFFNIWQSENERWGIVATLCDRKIWDGSHGAAGRAACWQVADEHTGPGTGRAGTGGAEGQREMLASLVKNVVGFKVRRANVSVSSSHSITAERGVKTNIYIYDCFVFFKNDRLNNNVLSPYIVLLR